jgi:hypothetical protein
MTPLGFSVARKGSSDILWSPVPTITHNYRTLNCFGYCKIAMSARYPPYDHP